MIRSKDFNRVSLLVQNLFFQQVQQAYDDLTLTQVKKNTTTFTDFKNQAALTSSQILSNNAKKQTQYSNRSIHGLTQVGQTQSVNSVGLQLSQNSKVAIKKKFHQQIQIVEDQFGSDHNKQMKLSKYFNQFDGGLVFSSQSNPIDQLQGDMQETDSNLLGLSNRITRYNRSQRVKKRKKQRFAPIQNQNEKQSETDLDKNQVNFQGQSIVSQKEQKNSQPIMQQSQRFIYSRDQQLQKIQKIDQETFKDSIPITVLPEFSDSSSQLQNNTLPQQELNSFSQSNPSTLFSKINFQNFLNASFTVYDPVPQNCVFQTVLKRYESEDNAQIDKDIVYQMFDTSTYQSILKVKKVSEGFEILNSNNQNSKYSNSNSTSNNIVPKTSHPEISCGLICSNFFNTSFNCFKFNRKVDKVHTKKLTQLISVNYETSFLGIKAPRKMDVYIPVKDFNHQGEKELGQIYEQDKTGISSHQRIIHFVNRTPRWNNSVSSFVLNFNGRATVPSVKNFIITTQQGQKVKYWNKLQKNLVVFGKTDRNSFNLDIMHPFSLVQGLALGLSSFQRKLGCD